ncbi:hypothetical protein ACI6Q2_09680 [Chitinophagaceae bacterium LWZ2-11]
MKKILNTSIALLLFITGSMFLTSCDSTPSPQKTFEIAALNSNLLSDFGSKQINRQLRSEPQVYDTANKKMIASTYYDYFKFQIADLENRYKNVEKIKVNDDNRELLTASKDLFSYAITKEKEGYLPIAKMKDQKASPEDIQKAVTDFDAATRNEIDTKFVSLMNTAKIYAKKNNINAKFGL